MKEIERFVPELSKYKKMARAGSVLYKFAKYGAKGLGKVNPVLMVLDAGISLVELGVSITKYKKVKEVNKQLEIKLKLIKKEYNFLKEKLEQDFKKFEIEIEQETEKFIVNLQQEKEIVLKHSQIIGELKETLEIIKIEILTKGYNKELEEQYLIYNEIFLNLIIGD